MNDYLMDTHPLVWGRRENSLRILWLLKGFPTGKHPVGFYIEPLSLPKEGSEEPFRLLN